MAEKLKDEGNLLFKDKKHREASVKFKEATTLLQTQFSQDLQKSDTANCKLYVVLLTNQALCYLNLKEVQSYEQAIAVCDRALKLDPENLKGLYRRGLAYKELGQLLEGSDAKCPRLPTLYKNAKDDLERLTLLDRKNQIAEQKLSETIKNFYRVRLLAKTEEQQQENTSDERYKGKLSEQAEKKAQRQTQTMEKIMKEYKVDEVAKLARTKVESELLEGELPKTRTEFEKAVKLLEKSRPSLVKFVLRLDGHYLSGINPNFDTLYKLVMALADTPEFQKSDEQPLQKIFLGITESKQFELLWKSLIPSQRKKFEGLASRAISDAKLLEDITKLKLV